MQVFLLHTEFPEFRSFFWLSSEFQSLVGSQAIFSSFSIQLTCESCHKHTQSIGDALAALSLSITVWLCFVPQGGGSSSKEGVVETRDKDKRQKKEVDLPSGYTDKAPFGVHG